MTRIIHLRDVDADFQTRKCVEYLRAGEAGQGSSELTIGPGGTFRNMLFAAVGLRGREGDVIHAWGSSALRVASMGARPVVFTPSPIAGRKDVRWLLAAGKQRPVYVACLSGESHRYLVEHGLPIDRCELVRPGVKMAGGAGGADAELRGRLGLKSDDLAILAVGESEGYANHQLALRACGILHFLNPRYQLILWGPGRCTRTLVRLQESWRYEFVQVAAERLGKDVGFDQIARAADMAVVTAEGQLPQLPMLACMAAGVPMVGLATRGISEVLEDHHTALLSPSAPKKLAQRLLQLAEDVPLQRKLADQARAEAYELYSVSRFVTEMRAVYEKV